MLYEEITVKNNISDIDFRRYVLLVSQNYFDQETGDYTPYAAREALRYGFYVYCVDGLPTEIEYESLMSDDNLLSIYNAKCLSGIVSEVNAMAKDMAEYDAAEKHYGKEILEVDVDLSRYGALVLNFIGE